MRDEEAIKELSAGFHKSALAIRELSVKHEACSQTTDSRLSALESTVSTGSMALLSRMAVLEVRLAEAERKLTEHEQKQSALTTARLGSRATITAAWIGGGIAFLAAILSLILQLLKG